MAHDARVPLHTRITPIRMLYVHSRRGSYDRGMGKDSELTDAALQSEIELLADLMTAATGSGDLTPAQVDDALGIFPTPPGTPEVV